MKNKANDNDLIILSDSDEIPDLTKLNQIKTSRNNRSILSHQIRLRGPLCRCLESVSKCSSGILKIPGIILSSVFPRF